MSGLRYASLLKANSARLARWTQILPHLSLLLREATLSIPEALLSAAHGSDKPDILLRCMVRQLQSEPTLSLAEGFTRSNCTGPETETLHRMFIRLGHGTLESRCLAVEQTAEELRLLHQQFAAKAEKDVKLWQTLGLIGGTCLTILLL